MKTLDSNSTKIDPLSQTQISNGQYNQTYVNALNNTLEAEKFSKTPIQQKHTNISPFTKHVIKQ